MSIPNPNAVRAETLTYQAGILSWKSRKLFQMNLFEGFLRCTDGDQVIFCFMDTRRFMLSENFLTLEHSLL